MRLLPVVVFRTPGRTLTYAKGSYNSIRGEITSAWKIENGVFTLRVAIPANTTATVVLPANNPDTISMQDGATEKLSFVVISNETAIELGSGKYTFSMKYK
jgi:alpha-L-rhamnosidase